MQGSTLNIQSVCSDQQSHHSLCCYAASVCGVIRKQHKAELQSDVSVLQSVAGVLTECCSCCLRWMKLLRRSCEGAQTPSDSFSHKWSQSADVFLMFTHLMFGGSVSSSPHWTSLNKVPEQHPKLTYSTLYFLLTFIWISFGLFLWLHFSFSEFPQRIFFFHFSLDSFKCFLLIGFSLTLSLCPCFCVEGRLMKIRAAIKINRELSESSDSVL